MNKFKVGDVIEYRHALYDSVKFNIGEQFEVTQVDGSKWVRIKPINNDRRTFGYYSVDQFEVVAPKLTPEEVLQYFKEDRQHELECSSTCFESGWVGMVESEDMNVSQILKRTWRVKPVPKTIDYYGMQIPKPVTKAEAIAEGLTMVYRPQLTGEIKVESVAVGYMIDYNVYFRTESEASQVVEVLLKPFK